MENWSAFSTNEAWLSVEQAGNTLKVKATRNENGQLRKASVVVNAGGLQKRVAVTQSSADVIFETETPLDLLLRAGRSTDDQVR